MNRTRRGNQIFFPWQRVLRNSIIRATVHHKTNSQLNLPAEVAVFDLHPSLGQQVSFQVGHLFLVVVVLIFVAIFNAQREDSIK